MNQTALYRFFDADGVLLYVGITENVKQRWTAHATQKRWWTDVAKKPVEWFDTREEAETAERRAIVEEKPLYNIVHSDKPRTKRRREPGPAAPFRLRVLAELESQNRTEVWLQDLTKIPVGAIAGWETRSFAPQASVVMAVADALGIDRNEAAGLSGLHGDDWNDLSEEVIAARDASDMEILMELSKRVLDTRDEVEIAIQFMRHAARPKAA